MDNELKDIVDRLNGYTSGWKVMQASRRQDGAWTLIIQALEPKDDVEPEAENDQTDKA